MVSVKGLHELLLIGGYATFALGAGLFIGSAVTQLREDPKQEIIRTEIDGQRPYYFYSAITGFSIMCAGATSSVLGAGVTGSILNYRERKRKNDNKENNLMVRLTS